MHRTMSCLLLLAVVLLCSLQAQEIGLRVGGFVPAGKQYTYRTIGEGGGIFFRFKLADRFYIRTEGAFFFNYPANNISAYPYVTKNPKTGKEYSSQPLPSYIGWRGTPLLKRNVNLPQRMNFYQGFLNSGYKFFSTNWCPVLSLVFGVTHWQMVDATTASLLTGDILQNVDGKDLTDWYFSTGLETEWMINLSQHFKMLCSVGFDYHIISSNQGKEFLGDPNGWPKVCLGVSYEFGGGKKEMKFEHIEN